jgi:TRAP-type C4-dicarboxylate transport system permease small subunit
MKPLRLAASKKPKRVFFEALDILLEYVVAICTAGFVVLCFLQVFFRYVLNNSISWSEEGSRFLFVIVVFLGGIICVKEKRHTNIDILVNLLPEKIRRKYMLVVYAFMFLFGLFLMYAGFLLARRNMYQLSAVLRVPLGVVYMIIPISGLFMAVNSIRVAFRDMTAPLTEEKEEGK